MSTTLAMCLLGDFLPECYDEWVLTERERLNTFLYRGLERLINDSAFVRTCFYTYNSCWEVVGEEQFMFKHISRATRRDFCKILGDGTALTAFLSQDVLSVMRITYLENEECFFKEECDATTLSYARCLS